MSHITKVLFAILLVTSPIGAQTGGDVNSRLITLNMKNVPVRDALDSVRRKANVKLLYGDRVVPENHKVSLKVKDARVQDVLNTILKRTGAVSRVSRDGQITIVRDTLNRSSSGNNPVTDGAVIIGRIIEAGQKSPIPQVVISIELLRISVQSDSRGVFMLNKIPAGTHRITVRMLGYQTQVSTVEVSGADTIGLDFALVPVANHLTEVVTTGSGDRQRYEVGNSISTIKADSVVQNSFVPTLADLLVNRAPGLQVVHGSGAVGSAKRIRIRGIQSIIGSNDPIVLIDGFRMNSGVGECRPAYSGIDVSCADRTSRLDDLDPDMIESIDILKGPAASTLYGSDAANGVIVIRTKRGQAGPARMNVRADNGFSNYPSQNFPVLTRALGSAAHAADFLPCGLLQLVEPRCGFQDTVIQFGMFRDKNTASIAKGRNTGISMDISGGYPTLQYFIAGSFDDRLGNSKMPKVNQNIIEKAKGGNTLASNLIRPNAEKRSNASIRLNSQASSIADFAFGANIMARKQRRGPNGMSDAFSFRTPDDTITLSEGWTDFFKERSENILHSAVNGTVNMRPFSILMLKASYGFDFSSADDKELTRRDACTPFCQYQYVAEGEVFGGRITETSHTFDLGSTVNIPITTNLSSRTAFGAQYVRTNQSDLNGYQVNLAYGQTEFRLPNLPSVYSPIRANFIDMRTDVKAVFGAYIDQNFTFGNRLFIGGAIRQDATSGLGPQGVKPVYPKFSVSWLLSEESFFPWKDLASFRLRFAYGHAGVQPQMTERLRTYRIWNDFINSSGVYESNVYIEGIGNQRIRPERTVESEYGFEVGILNDRFILDVTRFRKNTRDALASRPIPLSLGGSTYGTVRRAENIGDVRNTGTEITLGAKVVDMSLLSWHSNISYASRKNVLLRLDESILGDVFATNGIMDSRIVPGYPLFGRWARPILGFADENGDGIVSHKEIVLGDSMVFMGPSQPRFDMSINNGFGLLNGRFRVDASLQYQHSMIQYNEFLGKNSQALAYSQILGAGTLMQQAFSAASVQTRPGGSTHYGFMEKVNVLRFNNLSFTAVFPQELIRAMRLRGGSVGLLATNLGMWTSYSGVDPETNTRAADGNEIVDGGGLPQPRTWTLRLSLNF